MTSHAATRVYGAHGESRAVPVLSRSAYAGQVVESDTGWYLLGARPYAPAIRRFLSPDPLSPFGNGGLNRHVYCNGDPVDYVDPLGNNRRRVTPHVATVRTGASVLKSTGSVPGRSLTPGMTSVTTAARVGTSVISADIPYGSPTSPARAGSGVFGQLNTGGEPGYAASRKRVNRPQGDAGRTERKRSRVDILHEEDFPEERAIVDSYGHPDLERNWVGQAHLFNERSEILAADTVVNIDDIRNQLSRLRSRGVTSLTLYSGVHGYPSGRNWAADSWFRPDNAQSQFLYEDLVDTTEVAEGWGLHVHVVDMQYMNRKTMHEALSEDGVHVIGYCFGLADHVVMKAMGLPHTTVYSSWVRPPRWWSWPQP